MLGSLWDATAAETAMYSRLDGELSAQVVVVGAGYAGLSSAIGLADRGVDVVVLETHQPGWGASGRNGGILVPGVKLSPGEVVERLGQAEAARLRTFASAAPDAVFDMIERFGIDCDPSRQGWLLAAHSKRAGERLRARVHAQRQQGDPVEFLEQDAVRESVGSDVFFGGLLDRRGGHIQPNSYVRGLARGATSAGVRIFGGSTVEGLSRSRGSWTALTGHGSVSAERVIVATNGYTTDLTPKLRRTMIAVHSLLVATEPLGKTDVLTSDVAVSDTKRSLWYFRKDRGGRLVFGGRGALAEPKGAESYMRIMNGLRDLFPQLEGIKFDFNWGGRVALNRPHLPQINRPAPGMTSIVGFNGTGVAFATAIGQAVAGIAMGDEPGDVSPLPVTPLPVILFHGMQGVFAAVGTRYYELRDKLG